ncbi:MAG: YegP family protein [Clostridia bacterium]|nr:YegP family protein [Clostridia bacterium]
MLNKVIDFLKLVYHNYMSYVAVGIVLLAVIVVALIIFIKVQSNKLKSKRFDNNDQNAVTSLTPEEIDNISNNVADPDKLLEYISETNEKADAKKKKSVKKTTKQATKSKSAEKEKSNKDKPKEVATETQSKVKKETSKAKTQKPQAVEVKRQYLGKWKIIKEEDKFRAVLIASNGGILLKTENYTSLAGVKNGIQTIKKNIDDGHFAISVDKYSHFRFKLFSGANRLICISEDYSSKAKCENGIESVKRFAKDASIIIEDSYETK